MNYAQPCKYSIRLLDRLKSFDKNQKLDYNLINKAIYWAKKYHDGQFRKSGEPFYTHPLEVAYMISEHNLTTNVIVTSILHDIIEDTVVTAGMILDNFGWRIAEMVDMLTRDRPDGTKLSVEQILNNAYEKDDKEVLLVKLIDRVHNMMTIGAKPPEKIIKTADQTIEVFILLSMYLKNHEIENVILEKCYDILSIKTNLPRTINQLSTFNPKERYDTSQLLSQVFENEASLMYNTLKQE